MTDTTIAVLQAGINRMFEHRKAMRYVQTLCRVWPDGLAFSCHIVPRDFTDEPIPGQTIAEERLGITPVQANEATGSEIVEWDAVAKLDVAGVREIADRVCAKAHALLDPLLKPKLDA